MDLGRFWAFLALSSMSIAFSVYPLLPTPAPSEAQGIPPFFKLKSVPSYGSKRRIFQNSPTILLCS